MNVFNLRKQQKLYITNMIKRVIEEQVIHQLNFVLRVKRLINPKGLQLCSVIHNNATCYTSILSVLPSANKYKPK